MITNDPLRFEFDDSGVLHLRGYDGWREPICPVCGRPIAWVLDMFSFTTGFDYKLAHARCVWKREAFTRQRRLAPTKGPDD